MSDLVVVTAKGRRRLSKREPVTLTSLIGTKPAEQQKPNPEEKHA